MACLAHLQGLSAPQSPPLDEGYNYNEGTTTGWRDSCTFRVTFIRMTVTPGLYVLHPNRVTILGFLSILASSLRLLTSSL